MPPVKGTIASRRGVNMKQVFILTAVLMTACTAPVAKQYYADCVAAGYSEPECRMKATEIDQAAWANFSRAGQQLSESQRPYTQGTNMPIRCVENRNVTTCY